MSYSDREQFARQWAVAVAGTSYLAMGHDELVAHLRKLTDQMIHAVLATEFDPLIGHRIGADLVAGHFTGTKTLGETVALVVQQLPNLLANAPPGIDVTSRAVQLSGNLAAGYANALRERSLDEQDAIYRAGLRARRQAEQALAASEARFRGVFDSSPVGIVISEPDGRIVQANRSLENILGYSPGELPGRELGELFLPVDRTTVEEHYRGLVTGRESRFRVRFPLRLSDGETASVYLDATVLLDADQVPQCVVTLVDDITDLRLIERQLYHQTLHDVQTGLPNRQYFVTHLEKVLGQLDPSAVITLLHLDLDGFSAINDGLGHHVGELLLDVVARRLEAALAPQQAMIARLGADEYAILIEPGDSIPEVSELAETINTELAEPFYFEGIGVAVTATIGAVQRRVAGTKPEELMRAASATLRRIRGRGKRQWTLFDPDIDATHRAGLRLAAALPGALESGELQVTYQPVVTLDGHQLVAIDAGLRWQHPHLGELSHHRCVTAAERTGVVHDVGQWLLRSVAEQAVAWRARHGDRPPPVAVNLTPSQAQDPDLVARVRTVMDQTGLTPAELELRAPVTAIRTVAGDLADEGGEQAEDNLQVLSEVGIRVGLYDFDGDIRGLRCLAEIPVRVVRLAQPISLQVAEEPSGILSQAVRALVQIVRAAGVTVVAFPVESTEQAAEWMRIGVDWAAGALFGTPGPAQHIESLFEKQAKS